jgi:Signal transduction histidine kinase
VPEAIQARLFDLFYSTKEVGKGTGLGLSISQAIVAKRGGYIKYDPQYRQGARFIVKLPSVNLERVAA